MSSFSATGLISRYASRMTSGALLIVVVALFVISVIVPDPFPFVDEILLGLAALMLSRFRSRTVPDDDSATQADASVVAEQPAASPRSKSAAS